jgi:hypothetical protein
VPFTLALEALAAFFLDLLRRGFGELFEYDSESGQLVLGSDPAKVGV